ncbi:MAG: thioredoxin-like domain-containing protein, partial [Verrucomicrobiota bacterium]
MKTIAYTLSIIVFTVFSQPVFAGKMRTWTSAKGSKIEAGFVSLSFGKVQLEKRDGSRVSISLSKLSAADQRLARELGSPTAHPSPGGSTTVAHNTATPDSVRRLFGNELYTSSKQKVSSGVLGGKKIGIYFSANWCPPCKTFTPKLVKAYKQLKEQGKNFEIVFVSSDYSKSDMFSYMKKAKMPWYTLDFKSSEATGLSRRYGTGSIPNLTIVDETGRVLSRKGRMDVTMKGAGAFNGW